jgi:hypothetical protein
MGQSHRLAEAVLDAQERWNEKNDYEAEKHDIPPTLL